MNTVKLITNRLSSLPINHDRLCRWYLESPGPFPNYTRPLSMAVPPTRKPQCKSLSSPHPVVPIHYILALVEVSSPLRHFPASSIIHCPQGKHMRRLYGHPGKIAHSYVCIWFQLISVLRATIKCWAHQMISPFPIMVNLVWFILGISWL